MANSYYSSAIFHYLLLVIFALVIGQEDLFTVRCFQGYTPHISVEYSGNATDIYPANHNSSPCHGNQRQDGTWVLANLTRSECHPQSRYGWWYGDIKIQIHSTPSVEDLIFRYSCPKKYEGIFNSHTVHVGPLPPGDISLSVVNLSGKFVENIILGDVLRYHVSYIPSGGNHGLTVISCSAADRFPFPKSRVDMIISGCGTNNLIPDTKGFFTSYKGEEITGFSAPFRAFRIGSWTHVQYACSFVVCNDPGVCNGDSCKILGPRSKRHLSYPNIVLASTQRVKIDDMYEYTYDIREERGQQALGMSSDLSQTNNMDPSFQGMLSPKEEGKISDVQDWTVLISAILVVIMIMTIAVLGCLLTALLKLIKRRNAYLASSGKSSFYLESSDSPTSAVTPGVEAERAFHNVAFVGSNTSQQLSPQSPSSNISPRTSLPHSTAAPHNTEPGTNNFPAVSQGQVNPSQIRFSRHRAPEPGTSRSASHPSSSSAPPPPPPPPVPQHTSQYLRPPQVNKVPPLQGNTSNASQNPISQVDSNVSNMNQNASTIRGRTQSPDLIITPDGSTTVPHSNVTSTPHGDRVARHELDDNDESGDDNNLVQRLRSFLQTRSMNRSRSPVKSIASIANTPSLGPGDDMANYFNQYQRSISPISKMAFSTSSTGSPISTKDERSPLLSSSESSQISEKDEDVHIFHRGQHQWELDGGASQPGCSEIPLGQARTQMDPVLFRRGTRIVLRQGNTSMQNSYDHMGQAEAEREVHRPGRLSVSMPGSWPEFDHLARDRTRAGGDQSRGEWWYKNIQERHDMFPKQPATTSASHHPGSDPSPQLNMSIRSAVQEQPTTNLVSAPHHPRSDRSPQLNMSIRSEEFAGVEMQRQDGSHLSDPGSRATQRMNSSLGFDMMSEERGAELINQFRKSPGPRDTSLGTNRGRSHNENMDRSYNENSRSHNENSRSHTDNSRRSHTENSRSHNENSRSHTENSRSSHMENSRSHYENIGRSHNENSGRSHYENNDRSHYENSGGSHYDDNRRSHNENSRSHNENSRSHYENSDSVRRSILLVTGEESGSPGDARFDGDDEALIY